MSYDRHWLVALDIPLLFEIGAERRVDAVVVMTAPGFLQRQRVLRRPGMTREKLAAILRRQMPDREKRQRADFVIQTGRGRWNSLRDLKQVLTRMRKRRGSCWPRSWIHRLPGEE
jgi:dephospho-CoA kinase